MILFHNAYIEYFIFRRNVITYINFVIFISYYAIFI
jgi:hypothetical protein